jgi:SAM-dependent methyltransferase
MTTQVPQPQLDERVRDYLQSVRSQGTHTGKLIKFHQFLRDVFGLTDADCEVLVNVGRLQVRGRVDTVVGDSLFEFKTDLKKELADAESQLKLYLEAFHQQNPLRRCVGLATDGIKFRAYRALFAEDGSATVTLVEECDLSRLTPADAVLWIDRYLFRCTPKIPDERDVSERFGAGSPTHALAMAALRCWWERVKDQPPVALKYEIWQRQLTIVYGQGVGTEDLFLQHTYLATVAKLLASVVFGRGSLGQEEEVITGEYFRGIGIENFIEEDLFAWILETTISHDAARLLRDLRSQLGLYDAGGFTEDVLKGLYQQLVDPQMRHDLGEFYTPDWLAEYMLVETLGKRPESKVLDPACGSGTFLFLAIRLVTALLGKGKAPKTRILQHVSQNIVGVDVHPLAVLIARTNFLLAAAPLLKAPRKGAFVVPVYLGDSLMYRPFVGPLPLHEAHVPADGKWLVFPASVIGDPALFDQLVAEMVRAAGQGQTGQPVFRQYLGALGLPPGDAARLLASLEVLTDLFAAGRDSIWRFIVRNLVRPHILARAGDFDLVIGNPPWLSLRYITSADYQTFVKQRMTALKIKPKGAQLVTQLEMAALFFADSASHYLRHGGTIGFVMPRSLMTHRQWAEFVKFHFGAFGVKCRVILDLGEVAPLFSVPACAVLAEKGPGTRYPVKRRSFSGRLPRKNAGWEEAKPCLKLVESEWRPARPISRSYYHPAFRQGATIVPRRLWFVRTVVDPRLGFDAGAPLVESDPGVPARKPWHTIRMRGSVESRFLFASVLSTDILPFLRVRLRPVVLPLELGTGGKARMLTASDASGRGYPMLAEWVEQAERLWLAQAKGAQRTSTPQARLDYGRGLTAQFPRRGRYVILYATSARELAAAVLDLGQGLAVIADGGQLSLSDLAVDHKLYWYATDSREEAFYLCGWLNSGTVDDAVRPRATWGRYRGRDVHKRPLELPLPRFSATDPDHRGLAASAEQAAAAVATIVPQLSLRSLGAARRTIRAHPTVAPLLARIDELAAKIAGL